MHCLILMHGSEFKYVITCILSRKATDKWFTWKYHLFSKQNSFLKNDSLSIYICLILYFYLFFFSQYRRKKQYTCAVLYKAFKINVSPNRYITNVNVAIYTVLLQQLITCFTEQNNIKWTFTEHKKIFWVQRIIILW